MFQSQDNGEREREEERGKEERKEGEKERKKEKVTNPSTASVNLQRIREFTFFSSVSSKIFNVDFRFVKESLFLRQHPPQTYPCKPLKQTLCAMKVFYLKHRI